MASGHPHPASATDLTAIPGIARRPTMTPLFQHQSNFELDEKNRSGSHPASRLDWRQPCSLPPLQQQQQRLPLPRCEEPGSPQYRLPPLDSQPQSYAIHRHELLSPGHQPAPNKRRRLQTTTFRLSDFESHAPADSRGLRGQPDVSGKPFPFLKRGSAALHRDSAD